MNLWTNVGRNGTAIYPFNADGVYQISLLEGDEVYVDFEQGGWYRGTVFSKSHGQLQGIFPASYVNLRDDGYLDKPEDVETLSDRNQHEAVIVVKQVAKTSAVHDNRVRNLENATDERSLGTITKKNTLIREEPQPGRSGELVSFFCDTDDNETSDVHHSVEEPISVNLASSLTNADGKEISDSYLCHEECHLETNNVVLSNDGDVEKEMSHSPRSDETVVLAERVEDSTSIIESEQYDFSVPTRERSETMSFTNEINTALPGFELQIRELLANGKLPEHHEMTERLAQILTMRRVISDSTVDSALKESTRNEIIGLMESCRRKDKGYMCPRTPNHVVANVENTPIQVLLSLHRDMYSLIQKESSSLWQQKADARRSEMRNRVFKGRKSSTEKNAVNIGSILPKAVMSLHLDVKACIFSVGEPTHVFFSLFSFARQQFLTEEYVIELTASGMPEDINLLGKLRAEFRSLESSVFEDDIYLVCQIFRIGQLRTGIKMLQKKQKQQQNYRRPFGCAVLKLLCFSPIFEQLEQWVAPPHLVIYRAKDPLQFTSLHNLVIRGSSNIEVVPQAKGFAIGLKLGLMSAPSTQGFSIEMLTLSPNLHPGSDRNDFYVMLRGGDFIQDKKKSSKNIEIRVQVFTGTGYLVPNCIYRGAGPTVSPVTEYCSTVFYHTNNPTFSETLKLSISKQIFTQCHLLFTIWHVSSSPDKNQLCSFSFLPLTCPSGAVITDGIHALPCYKPIKNLGQPNSALPPQYLSASAHYKTDSFRQQSQIAITKRKEEIFVETQLSSVTMTQLDSLHSLFNWRQLDTSQLRSMITKITMTSGTELAKYIKETFDGLFAILCAMHHVDEISVLAFSGLLHTVDQLTTKMCAVGSTVDLYIADVFTVPDVYLYLISNARQALVYAAVHHTSSDSAMFKQLTLLCKCFQHVLKFIIKSAQCSEALHSQTFKDRLMELLEDVTALFTLRVGPKDPLIGCKAFLLRSFYTTFDDLSIVFSPEVLGQICLNILNAVPHHADNAKLYIYKLRMIGSIAQSVIGRQAHWWSIIQSNVIDSLQFHLSSSNDEAYLSIGILSDLIRIIQIGFPENPAANLLPFNKLLHPLLLLVRRIQSQEDLMPSQQVHQMYSIDLPIDSISLLYIIIHYMDDDKLTNLIVADDEITRELVSVCESSLLHRVYPSMWIVLDCWELCIFARILQSISSHVGQLRQPVIQSFFHVCVLFQGHKDLQNLSEAKTEFLDNRVLPSSIRSIIRQAWASIADYSAISHFFCSNLLVPLSRDANSNENCPSHDLAIDMFADLLEEEYARSGGLSAINRFTVDALDVLANDSQDDAQKFVELLDSSLRRRLASSSSSLQCAVQEFLCHLSTFYNLMQGLLRIPKTDTFEHERANVVNQLLDFLMSDSNAGRRKAMLYRYYTYLIDLNVSLGAFAEAGNAALKQLKLLDWVDVPVSSWEISSGLCDTSKETESARKELLYLRLIDHFDHAELWEKSIEACEDLRQHYQHSSFDYLKLSDVLERQALLFRKIITEPRFFPSYFRVVYYSKSNPPLEYVFRGMKLESIMDFTERIRSKHTDARIIMSNKDPPPSDIDQNELVITITMLTIASFDEYQGISQNDLNLSNVPCQMQKYQLNDNLSWFVFCQTESRALQGELCNEFKDLWVKKTYIRTEEAFPCTRRRLKIVESGSIDVHPIDSACETIVKKNRELHDVITSVNKPFGPHDLPIDVGPLTMQLNGIIDAAVNGGSKKYIDAFFHSVIEGKQDSQNSLKTAMETQIVLLRQGLNAFKERKSADLDPLYNRLRVLFEKMVVSFNDLL
uniref:SH3 domain-containing protein n=1 Tax=Spongospora subterranea TaxID=70186 RepID=A0A0H5QIY3_9EUKA|eukprot:CRZ01261.1 hypothetical protein [Spongospora subterranea]